MDRRTTPYSGEVAHVALKGQVAAARFTEGEPAQVGIPLVDLLAHPEGPRDRQLLLGERFLVIDRREGHAFGRADRDGYCGWLPEAALAAPETATHHVAVPASHLYPEPRVQAHEIGALSFGARLTVIGEARNFFETTVGWVPARHLWPVDRLHSDPVAVARLFHGTPYLWGGNSRAGIDCSGLAQAALLACGIECPGDSDLQQAVGSEVTGELQAGDLLFWKGHVALAIDARRMIHATGYVMGVIEEEIEAAIARITAAGEGPVLARRRP
ncbi:C40 family peptidase [Cereibacter azotoformans]|uniref:C40 family peptidase n=1 Tax=Cereibacter azotoformans TaxID=43057 RepID=UPI003B2110A2